MNYNSHLPVLATERLLLRVPTARDAPVMVQFAEENREHLAPWDPDRDDDYFSIQHWQQQLADNLESVRDGTFLQFVFFEQGHGDDGVVGQCTLSGITGGAFQAAFLGYGLHHAHVGKGYMSEALRAVIDYAFEEMNLHRIMANYMPANERSRRLLEKLGFEREGYARDYLHLAGRWQDHVLTSLINPDWKKR